MALQGMTSVLRTAPIGFPLAESRGQAIKASFRSASRPDGIGLIFLPVSGRRPFCRSQARIRASSVHMKCGASAMHLAKTRPKAVMTQYIKKSELYRHNDWGCRMKPWGRMVKI